MSTCGLAQGEPRGRCGKRLTALSGQRIPSSRARAQRAFYEESCVRGATHKAASICWRLGSRGTPRREAAGFRRFWPRGVPFLEFVAAHPAISVWMERRRALPRRPACTARTPPKLSNSLVRAGRAVNGGFPRYRSILDTPRLRLYRVGIVRTACRGACRRGCGEISILSPEFPAAAGRSGRGSGTGSDY